MSQQHKNMVESQLLTAKLSTTTETRHRRNRANEAAEREARYRANFERNYAFLVKHANGAVMSELKAMRPSMTFQLQDNANAASGQSVSFPIMESA